MKPHFSTSLATIGVSLRGLSDMMYSSFYSFYGTSVFNQRAAEGQSKSMLG